jgi:hypothetical protein
MLESIDSPQGDQVARTAATAAIGRPRAKASAVTDISVPVVLVVVVRVDGIRSVLVVVLVVVLVCRGAGRRRGIRGTVEAGVARADPAGEQFGVDPRQVVPVAHEQAGAGPPGR